MRKLFDFLIVIAILLLLWQMLHWVAGELAMTSPVETAVHIGTLLTSEDFWADAAETGRALQWAVAISVIGGIVLGVLIGMSDLARLVTVPIFISLYSLPKVTLYPLVLLCFGLTLSSKVAFGAMHGMFPVVLFTVGAIANIRPVYMRVASVLRLSRLQTIGTVVLPAIFPEVLSGIRIGFSLSLLGVLIGEMFASRKGLGFRINRAMEFGDISTIMAVAVLLSVFAFGINFALLVIARRMNR
jgi:NitT/TauT family transport system permease protein